MVFGLETDPPLKTRLILPILAFVSGICGGRGQRAPQKEKGPALHYRRAPGLSYVHNRPNKVLDVEHFSTAEIKPRGPAPLPAWFARLAGMPLIVVTSAAATRTPASARTATTAGTPAAAGSARTAAIGLGTRFVNVQCPSAELFPVEGSNGFLGLGGVGHFYKCKSSRTTRVTISDHADLIDLAMRLKQGP
jgi:hypothetical protein